MQSAVGLEVPDELLTAATDPTAYARLLPRYHPADTAEALNRLPLAFGKAVLDLIPLEIAIQIFSQSHLDHAAALIEALTPERAAAIIKGLSADRRADIMRKLPPNAHARCLAKLDEADRAAVQQLLSYPPQTAGAIMTTEFLAVPETATVADTLQVVHTAGAHLETVYVVYLTDPASGRLTQVVSLRQLVTAAPSATVGSITSGRPVIAVTPTTDREEIGRLISKYNLLALPVLDADRHIQGIVTVDDVIDAIVEEGTEDVQKFGGSEALDEPYLQISFAGMIKKRAGWLCALFLSEMLTADCVEELG